MRRIAPACGIVLLGLLQISPPVSAESVTLNVTDAATGEELPARVYLQGADGTWHFASADGAETYDKQNWINAESIERHTCILAGPATFDLPPGTYRLTVERGKEYLPHGQEFTVDAAPLMLAAPLRRWINMADRGWYSGETHLHRTLDELRTVVLAEDLNVAFPLSYWETRAGFPPTQGNKNIVGEIPPDLVVVDDTHVIWPRNTEYEIFTVGDQRHTLGALFVLNHRSVLDRGVPPWEPVVDAARAEGALFDLDKLDWPVGLALPPLTGDFLYELANNHNWRTEFAFKDWNSPTAGYLQPPFGGTRGNERDWLLYSLGMYYTLLNTGARVMPTAGTANGVHPVPAGFSRVYVQLDGEFSYDDWLSGLRAGRSFVTTGPMLFATVGGESPGHAIELGAAGGTLRLQAEVISEQPVTFCELVRNGVPVATFMGRSEPRPEGGWRMAIDAPVELASSGWIALRAWENRADGRFRFAHTAPWWVDVEGTRLAVRPEERTYLISRVQAQIDRSRDVLSPEALAEYDHALNTWRDLPVNDAPIFAASKPRPVGDNALDAWLDNMLRYHRFTVAEAAAATGLDDAVIAQWRRDQGWDAVPDAEFSDDRITILPYPGGRHPRAGFLDGALQPQRDTKFSAFLPWPRPDVDPPGSRGYIVVDVPEAIFTNLGLTYLAHTHVPTIWGGVDLPPVEWTVTDESLEAERLLPNGIRFGVTVAPQQSHIDMELWLTNGTDQPLTGMRVQNCVMLKAAPGFHDQTNANKLLREPLVAVHDETGRHWIITAWTPNHRAWSNPPVPCLHSDPVLPDCPPGQTTRAHGRIWFFEGSDIDAELERLATEFPAAR